jgi:hypothetical protein
MMPFRSLLQTLAVTLAAFAAIPACTRAETPALTPGEYITEGGWGVLTISGSETQTTHFSLEATGANGHSCSLEGDVQSGKAILPVDDSNTDPWERSCVVTFRPNAEGIDVSNSDPKNDVNLDTCRYYCGMRAHFEGEYLIPNPGCTTEESSATRARFEQLYESQSYGEAAAVLEPLLAHCSKTLGREGAWIANDLAITQYHLGRLADCRKTLEPLAKDIARTDEVRSSLPPLDLEQYLSLAKATRHNLRLCARKGRFVGPCALRSASWGRCSRIRVG